MVFKAFRSDETIRVRRVSQMQGDQTPADFARRSADSGSIAMLTSRIQYCEPKNACPCR
jgi:hypothetical protein